MVPRTQCILDKSSACLSKHILIVWCLTGLPTHTYTEYSSSCGKETPLKLKEKPSPDFCHPVKNHLPFRQDFIGRNQAIPRRSIRSKSSQHLLIIFPWLLSFQRVSYDCQGAWWSAAFISSWPCSVTVINNSNKNQNKDLPSRLQEIEALFSHFLDGKI